MKSTREFYRTIFLWLAVIMAGLLCVEGGFRLYLKLSEKNAPVLMRYDQVLEQAWFKPHPHLVYVFKPNHHFQMDDWMKARFTTNSFGYRSTLEFDVTDVSKPKDTLRIVVIGGSTVMGLNDDDKVWPYLLGKNLNRTITNKKFEILNAGLMGYTSLDNLIDLGLRLVDFDSDIYIVYLGVNDYVALAPLSVYRSDHSHYRTTLWESLSFSPIELLPGWLLKSEALAVLLNKLGVNERKELLKNTGTRQFRKMHRDLYNNRFSPVMKEGTELIKDNIIRNIRSMVGIIKAHNPNAHIILSSFCYKDAPLYINRLNEAIANYSTERGLVFVDTARLVSGQRDVLIDSEHFNFNGEQLMAQFFTEAVLKESFPRGYTPQENE